MMREVILEIDGGPTIEFFGTRWSPNRPMVIVATGSFDGTTHEQRIGWPGTVGNWLTPTTVSFCMHILNEN
jgi:hypothetical protein